MESPNYLPNNQSSYDLERTKIILEAIRRIQADTGVVREQLRNGVLISAKVESSLTIASMQLEECLHAVGRYSQGYRDSGL